MEKRRMTKLTALILAICLFVSMQISGFCVSATETEENINETADYKVTNFFVSYEGEKKDEYNTEQVYNEEDVTTLIRTTLGYDNILKHYGNSYVNLLGNFNDYIPVLEIEKNDNLPNKPIVVVQHGFGGNKHNCESLMYELANDGYRVVAIDSYRHGARRTNSNALSASSLQIALRTTIDLDIVLGYYENKAEVKANLDDFAMVGVSMGALATYNQLAFGNYKPSVIVPMIGTPNINTLLATSDNADFITSGCNNSSIILVMKTFFSPINNFTEIDWNNTAILATNGNSDTLIPPAGTVNFFNSLPDDEKHINFVYDNVTHYITYEMCINAINFIKVHLPVRNSVILRAENNTCIVDGTEYTDFDVQPIINEGNMLLPIRSVITNYWGWNVGYDSATDCVLLTKEDTTVSLEESEIVYIESKSYLTVEDYARIIGVNCEETTITGKIPTGEIITEQYILMTPSNNS